MKLRTAGRHSLELIAVVNGLLMACSIDQPELAALHALRIAKQPLDVATKRRYSGSGTDEDGILQRITQSKEPMGTMKADGFAFPHVAQEIRKKTVLHPVQAQVELQAARRGRNGIRACDLPAFLAGHQRQKLSRKKAERRHILHPEFQVPGLLGKLNGAR